MSSMGKKAIRPLEDSETLRSVAGGVPIRKKGCP